MSATFTVDARDLFTVHKAGCAHLRSVDESQRFDIVAAESTQAAIFAELEDFDQGNGVEEVIALGPCLKGIQ